MNYDEQLDLAVEQNNVSKWAWLDEMEMVNWLEERGLQDIHDVALYYGLIDRKPWSDETKVCCINPEHDDKNPSMSIWRGINGFKCWSCGFSGKLKQFIETKESKYIWKKHIQL